MQVSARFTAGAWDAYELGVFLSDGTLFAVGSSSMAGDFPTKEAGTDVVVTCTLLISDVPSGSVTVDASIQTTVPNATTTERGIVELADAADPETDNERAMTPALVKSRIDTAIDGLAGTAPAVLDTLTEIAAALKNNPVIVDELLAAIALRARLDGAVFTGATQGLTRAAGDDTTHFATTAFVQDATPDAVDAIDDLIVLAGLTATQLAAQLIARQPALTATQMAVALLAAYPALTATQMATVLLATYPALTATQMAVALLATYLALTATQMAMALLATGYGVNFDPRAPIETQETVADFPDALVPTEVVVHHYSHLSADTDEQWAHFLISELPDFFALIGIMQSEIAYASGTVTITISEDTGRENDRYIEDIVVW